MDGELNQAVEAAVREEAQTPGLLLTGYLIIAATKGFDDDGDAVTAVTVIPSDIPIHECLGLLEHARIRFFAETLADYRDDD